MKLKFSNPTAGEWLNLACAWRRHAAGCRDQRVRKMARDSMREAAQQYRTAEGLDEDAYRERFHGRNFP